MPAKKQNKKKPATVTIPASEFHRLHMIAVRWDELCLALGIEDPRDSPDEIKRKLQADKTDATQERTWATNWTTLCDALDVDLADSYDKVRSLVDDMWKKASHFSNLVDTLDIEKDARTAGGVVAALRNRELSEQQRVATDERKQVIETVCAHLGRLSPPSLAAILSEVHKLRLRAAQYETDAAKWVAFCQATGQSPATSAQNVIHREVAVHHAVLEISKKWNVTLSYFGFNPMMSSDDFIGEMNKWRAAATPEILQFWNHLLDSLGIEKTSGMTMCHASYTSVCNTAAYQRSLRGSWEQICQHAGVSTVSGVDKVIQHLYAKAFKPLLAGNGYEIYTKV